jgi:hypothetical protein
MAPPAAYTMVEQVGNRGVYSFCMCPGGVIVPAATAPGELVVNGMSPSHRGGKYANSGIVTEIRVEDIPAEFHQYGIFAGLEFQQRVEKNCFMAAGESQMAPAQRLSDFTTSRKSSSLPDTSYRPGIVSSDMGSWLPDFVTSRLREGLIRMGRKSHGYLTNEAILLGTESRTSSPLRRRCRLRRRYCFLSSRWGESGGDDRAAFQMMRDTGYGFREVQVQGLPYVAALETERRNDGERGRDAQGTLCMGLSGVAISESPFLIVVG